MFGITAEDSQGFAALQGSEEVASALSCMGMSCVQGILLEANAIKLDIAIPISRTAIFLDGPQAFCANDRSALGSTKLKWRIAAERGWTVCLPHMTESNARVLSSLSVSCLMATQNDP